MNPESNTKQQYRAGQNYVSGGATKTATPIKLGGGSSGSYRAGQNYKSSAVSLKTNEDLYELAQQAGLGDQADEMIKRSGGESQKFMSGGFIMDAMDILNAGSYGFVGLVKGKGFVEGIKNRESLSDDDALGKFGWQGKIAGFVGDILLDPLTYVSPFKQISKIPGVSKGLATVTEKMFGKLKEIEVGANIAGLADEARKFKSADEFIKSNGVPRGTVKYNFDGEIFSIDSLTDTKTLADSGRIVPRDTASGWFGNDGFAHISRIDAGAKGTRFYERVITELKEQGNNKIAVSLQSAPSEGALKRLVDEGKLKTLKSNEFGVPTHFEITDSIKTKTQLEDIWNKASVNKAEVIDGTVKTAVAESKVLADAKALDEMESIVVKGQKTFKREGGWGPLVFLSNKLVYGFAASRKYLDGVMKISGRNESILGDAEKLFTAIGKISPDLFNKTVVAGADGRMITSSLQDVEIGLMREGLDKGVQHVRDIYKLRDSLMNRLVELKVLTKETAEEHWGTYLKQSYDEYLEASKSFSGTKSGIGINSKKRVEELTPEMMAELGQVKDGAVLWATTLLKQIDLVKKAELQQFTADGFAMTADMLGEFGKKGGLMKDLHQIPNDQKMYGALAGKYVSNEVWNTLKGSFNPTKELGENLILKFKHIKVVWNPASHVRNAFSATIQNWWKMGMGPWRMDLYYDALNEFNSNGKYLQQMKELGFSERSGYFSELMNNYLTNQELMAKTLKSQFGEAIKPVKYLKKVDRLMLNSYGHTDNIAKVAGFKYGLSKGLSKEDAYAQAMAATFNYSEITPFVHQMRRAIWGVPFITFALKATPLVATTLVNNPSRISVFGKIRNDLFKAAGVEGEQESEAMPDYMRDDMFVMRVPWKDSEGRSMYFDMSYIIPFGAIADGSFLKDPASSNPIVQTIRELSRNETFSGSKIFNESDDVEEVLRDISVHIMKLALPKNVTDFIPDGYRDDGSRVPSKVGWERFAGTNTQDRGPGERTFYQYVFSSLGVGATPFELNSKESAMAYRQRENLSKMLTENGVIKTFNSPYLPKDSKMRPENQPVTNTNLYDKTDKPIGR